MLAKFVAFVISFGSAERFIDQLTLGHRRSNFARICGALTPESVEREQNRGQTGQVTSPTNEMFDRAISWRFNNNAELIS